MSFKLDWMDDGIAEGKCSCGQQMMLHTVGEGEFPGVCTNCGQAHSLVQYVFSVAATGRCRNCNRWLHGNPKRVHCSEACGVAYRKRHRRSE